MRNSCRSIIHMTVTALMVSAYAVHGQDEGVSESPAQDALMGETHAPMAPPPVESELPAAAAVTPAVLDPVQEMQQIQMQLQQVSMQLQQIQQQALQVQEVMDAFEAYEVKLREKMLALSPDSAADIEAAEELVKELRSVPDPSMLSEEEAQAFQAKYIEFQQTAQRLQPIEQQVSMDPEMQEARSELEDKVMSAMHGVHPDAEAMLEQHETLVERYMELEQQRRQQEAPEQPSFEMPEF